LLVHAEGMIPRNILLVEDNPVNQLMTSCYLTKCGHHVTIANDGNDALEKIQNHRFNIVLMDVNLPGMDGFEVTLLIRSLEDQLFKSLPILAFTSCTSEETKAKAKQTGMTDFLCKPLDPEEINQKINQYTMETHALNAKSVYRPLHVPFENYTDGESKYKLELIHLIMANIRELQHAVHCAYHLKEFYAYQNVSHKVKSSILLLNDPELTQSFEYIKTIFKTKDSDPGIDKVNKFIRLLSDVLKSLEKEALSIADSH
jgi:CheY-like chemotaxis protein